MTRFVFRENDYDHEMAKRRFNGTIVEGYSQAMGIPKGLYYVVMNDGGAVVYGGIEKVISNADGLIRCAARGRVNLGGNVAVKQDDFKEILLDRHGVFHVTRVLPNLGYFNVSVGGRIRDTGEVSIRCAHQWRIGSCADRLSIRTGRKFSDILNVFCAFDGNYIRSIGEAVDVMRMEGLDSVALAPDMRLVSKANKSILLQLSGVDVGYVTADGLKLKRDSFLHDEARELVEAYKIKE